MWFKNIIVYRITGEFNYDEAQLEEKLQDQAFTPCGSQDLSRYGWVSPSNGLQDTLLHSVHGFHMIAAQKEEKILPPAVVKQQVEEKTNEFFQKNIELEQANKQLENAATVDKVTGVKSRRYLDIYIEQASRLMSQIHENILPVQRNILPRLYMVMVKIEDVSQVSNSQLVNLTDLLLFSRNKEDLIIRWSDDIFAIIGYEKDDGFNVKPVAGVNDGDEHGFESYNVNIGYQNQLTKTVNAFVNVVAYDNEGEYDNTYGTNHEEKVGRTEFRSINTNLAYNEDNLTSTLDLTYTEQDNYDYVVGKSKKSGGITSINQINAAWLNSYRVNEQLALGGGLDYRREELDEGYTGFSYYKPEENPRENYGVSVISQYTIDSWTLEASARNDENSQYGNNTTWQAAAGWTFLDNYELKASHGTAFRAPTFLDLYYPGFEAPNLKAEDSQNTELTLEGSHSYLDWSITGFINKIDNMLMWQGSGMTNIGEAEIKGVELGLGFDTSIVTHQFYLDWKDPVDKSNGKEQQLAYRSKQGAKWNAFAEFGDWILGSQYLYQGERFNGTTRLASYSLWNFTAEYAVSADLKVKGKLSNAFDKDYEMYSGYATPGREYFISAIYQF